MSYTNVGPGDYRFRIAAVNELGQWNQRDMSISLTVLPTFRQTPLLGSPGMAERAARIGATLVIGSPLIGTRVRLTIPAAPAYAGHSRWKRLVRRLTRRG